MLNLLYGHHKAMGMTKDPVCGMMVDEASAAGHVQYLGKDYYFCSELCQRKFEESPQIYLEAAAASTPSQPRSEADALYTCPIDSMVLAPRPGTCPICGNPLVLLVPSQPAPHNGDQCA